MVAASVDTSKFVELLRALQSSQNLERQQAETLYQQAKAAEPDSLVLGLLAVVGSGAGLEEAVRRHAAVLLRQLVTRGSEKDFAFARLTLQRKQEFAAELLKQFEAESCPHVQKKVGEVVSKLAEYVCDPDDPRGWLYPGQGGWPELLPLTFRMADASQSSCAGSCETAVRLLKEMLSTLKEPVIGAQQQLGSILQNGLNHSDLKIRCAVLLLICEMVEELEKKDWAPLLATVGVLCQILGQLVSTGVQEFQDELQECLQALGQVAAVEPDFFKRQLAADLQPARLLADLVKARDGVDGGLRIQALEWLVTFTEKKPKWIAKGLPGFLPIVLECCMDLMLEVDAEEAELQAWAVRMDDEEGEEDADECFHAGEEALDRVARAMTMDGISAALFPLIGSLATQEAWQAKHAALAAIRQTAEFVEDTQHMNDMAEILARHADHAHPRVRFITLHALGQIANDQSPHFQEAWHQTVMPLLLRKMDDPADRVAAMAMSAFVSFGEELDDSLMHGYSQGFMEKLVQRLGTSSHRGVREESITSIAIVAGVIGKEFSQYYDLTMPMLKQLVMHATGEKENRLRGKAFECMSLLGLAVGKERFLPDAEEAIAEMLKTPIEADDMQREYIKEANERICTCLDRDFAIFLPAVLPGVFRALKLEDREGQDNRPDYYDSEEGKISLVKNSRFEEILSATQLIYKFCEVMGGAYFDWVAPTAQALLPHLSMDAELAWMCEGARGWALHTWAVLIKCARAGATERGLQTDLPRELLGTFLQRILQGMEKEKDPETLADAASGIAECFKNVGPGVLSDAEATQLVQQLFALIDESFQRSSNFESLKKAANVGAPPELEQDEDAEDGTADCEEACRRACEETLGAVMRAAPAQFLKLLPDCGRRITEWLNSGKKVLALYLACDLIEHLGEQTMSIWPIFMPEVFRALADQDPDARIAGAYAVNLAAHLPGFEEAAPEAFTLLAKVVGGSTPKRRDDKAKAALDNGVAALLALAKEMPARCPQGIEPWQLVVRRLPLRQDEEEAKKVHAKLVDLVLEQHAGLLGPARQNLGMVLSALVEVYHQENVCSKDTDAKILRVFQLIPCDNLVQLAGCFSEKQRRKIEKMLTTESVLHGG